MKLKICKTLLEAALVFQAKNDVRYYLNGICFMPDGRVASTNGHQAFIGCRHDNKIKENVIVSVSKPPVKCYDMAELDTETGIVTYNKVIKYKDEGDVITMVGAGICRVIDGRFPDIDRIIPKEKSPAEEIGFNAKYLADIEKAAKLLNPKFEGVRFELNGNTSAAVANLESPEGLTAKVIVMPMRL